MVQVDAKTQLYFSPQDDTVAEFEKLLDSATKSIHLADYSFNIPEVARVLISKYQQGIDTKLVLDRTQSAGKSEKPVVQALLDADVPLKIVESSDHQIMHNKFTIIDGIVCQAGSWNYTASAADENNFYFVINDDVTAAVFEQDFQSMWTGVTSVIESTNVKGETNG